MTYPKPTKAVIAAAGFGTRFLPQTKAMPKEMLPLIDKPIIQQVVEELVGAGIRDIIIVTGQNKRSIEDHFDSPSADLVATLENGGKEKSLEHLHEIANMANFVYVRQKEPLGNAAPLIYAGHLIQENEPFIYAFADDFIEATPSRFQQMIDVYQQTGGSVLSCIRLEKDEDYNRYGVVGGESIDDTLIKMNTIFEKPGKANAPSELGSVSSYLFTGGFLPYVNRIAQTHNRATDGELKIQTAMQLMIDEGHPYYAKEITNGRFYDAGDKLEYMKTVVDFALRREDIGEDFREYLRKVIC
jgi:UTP--glucose-1-phosphate uridylyltransferase